MFLINDDYGSHISSVMESWSSTPVRRAHPLRDHGLAGDWAAPILILPVLRSQFTFFASLASFSFILFLSLSVSRFCPLNLAFCSVSFFLQLPVHYFQPLIYTLIDRPPCVARHKGPQSASVATGLRQPSRLRTVY